MVSLLLHLLHSTLTLLVGRVHCQNVQISEVAAEFVSKVVKQTLPRTFSVGVVVLVASFLGGLLLVPVVACV